MGYKNPGSGRKGDMGWKGGKETKGGKGARKTEGRDAAQEAVDKFMGKSKKKK